jgi:serine/threonine protein kinase
MYAAPEVIYGKPYSNKVDLWGAGVILHLLLTGTYPFYHDNPEIVMRRIVTCDAPWRNDMWLKVSPEAKDLCKRLLQVRPNSRPTADEALNHSWLKEVLEPTDGPERVSTLEREKLAHVGDSDEQLAHIIRDGTPAPVDRSAMMDNLKRETPLQARFKQEFMSRYTEEYFERLAQTAKALTEALFVEQVDKVSMTITPPPDGSSSVASLARTDSSGPAAPIPDAALPAHLASNLELQVCSETSESTLPEEKSMTDRVSQMSLSGLPTLQQTPRLETPRSASPRRRSAPRLTAETQDRIDKLVVGLTAEPPADLQQLLKEDKGVKLADLRPMD